MAVLADHRTVGAPFSNASQLVKITYDFGVDGGTIADYDVLTADGDIIVEYVNTDVEVALTSSDAILIDLGKGAGGIEFQDDRLKAVLALDAQVLPETPGQMIELADGEKIVMGIEAFAATAGKWHHWFRIYKRGNN